MLRRLLTIAVTVLALTLGAYGQGAAAKAADAKKTATKAADAKTALIDINSATGPELEALPGIGKAYSAKIIAARPYANKSQLVSKGVLPESVFKKISDKIIAKQK
ncbi:MAG: helix-hairpin-helix domain-containing protein [Acidobacteria bacterium]|nr:helix-hairpin-helix domain-containing protein [Acidobacteriota bacterium]